MADYCSYFSTSNDSIASDYMFIQRASAGYARWINRLYSFIRNQYSFYDNNVLLIRSKYLRGIKSTT